ncbi:MAG: FHA domain-containing protein [Planctomycetaceae bacterium]
MLDLSAQGPEPTQLWRKTLKSGVTYTLGRSRQADLSVPWDAEISACHATAVFQDERLTVRVLPEARNPLFFQGNAVESCEVSAERHFVLGQTLFRVLKSETTAATRESPVEEVAFTPQELQKVRYQDPDNRLDVLTHLPEVIAGARDERELHHRLVNLLLKGVVHAEAVAIVSAGESEAVNVWHWERRRETEGEFSPRAGD